MIAVLQVPLAWRMARRIRNAQRDRELLLQRAIDASDQERQSIAAGLHDGVVQELAGHSFQMAAAIEQHSDEPELRRVLAEGAAGTRNAIRQLRSLLLEIYPPALRDHGLAAALPDWRLLSPRAAWTWRWRCSRVWACRPRPSSWCSAPRRRRSETPPPTPMREHVSVGVSGQDGAVTLLVADDGRGFDRRRAGRAPRSGPHGAVDGGRPGAIGRRQTCGDLQPGAGTSVELEVPAR